MHTYTTNIVFVCVSRSKCWLVPLVCTWRLEGNPFEVVLSFQHVGPTQVIRSVSAEPPPQPSF